ncbi:hypothetical protein [Rhodospirillum sp. A1_3_36]
MPLSHAIASHAIASHAIASLAIASLASLIATVKPVQGAITGIRP